MCGGKTENTNGSNGNTEPQHLRDFVKGTLLENGNVNWPTSTAITGSGNEAKRKPEPQTNDNAKAVAQDLVNLNSDEKTKVAGLLAKTIEGGEVLRLGRFLLLL
ncbi:hypothetical protein P029_04545 [Anaplasma phagocytophilum str. Norway variant2]|uniref:Uncharacterized protein n=1 Tax=Anaplasma phagocytophilum str. Norway variant2 TaxID=1392507 RepID=A0A161IRG2_ANAPH|nr:hypothetical protein P029_04545 [Anaplasma phagocytophilum str. Norway variant2]